MPIYEYQCQACGHEMDRLQKMSDPPLTDCPECGKPALKKKISAAGFRLKGGGWYETDFKQSKNKKNLADGGGSDTKKTDSSGKSDKPAKTTKGPAKASAPSTKS